MTKQGFEHPRFMQAVVLLHPGVDLRAAVSVVYHGEAPTGVTLKEGDGPFGFELRKWELPGEPPTYAEVEAMADDITVHEARMQRAAAMKAEADPLLAKWLAGEIDKSVWEGKRAEIRARFPHPAEGDK